MSDDYYSFDDTDALLASISGSSIPTLSPSDLGASSSTTKTSSYGVSPEEILFKREDWPEKYEQSNEDFFSNNDMIEFNLQQQNQDINENFDSEERSYISPLSDELSPQINLADKKKVSTKDEFSSLIPNFQTDDQTVFQTDDKTRHSSSDYTIRESTKNKVVKPRKDRSSHNVIEKKYRTNINAKITALRDAVPSLRIAAGDTDMSINDLEGLSPASKVNKASVLTKATEYIKHLERKNATLASENDQLKQIIGNISTPQQRQQQQQQQPVFPQFAIGQPQPQQQLRQPQQAPQHPLQPPPPNSQPQHFQDFQPATNYNGQPLNIVSQQQQQPYQVGLPGKVLMGGLTTLVGQNLFNNGNEFEYRGLSAFPFLATPQFHTFLNVAKFFLVFTSLVYIFLPSLFYRTKKETKSNKTCPKVRLNELYSLIKERVFISVGEQERKVAAEGEVTALINKEIFIITNENRSAFSFLVTLLKLGTYESSFEVAFGKLVISQLLLAYSDVFAYFNFKTLILNSLEVIAKQKVSDTNLRYFFKDFKTTSGRNSECFKRLLNLSLNLGLDHNCERGVNDKGYALVLKDEKVIYDYKQLLLSLRSNELFREALLEYINLTFNEKEISQLDVDELKEVKKKLWDKISFAERLAPAKSIVDIRIKIFKSVLNEKYLDSNLRLIAEEAKAVSTSDTLNGFTFHSNIRAEYTLDAETSPDEETSEAEAISSAESEKKEDEEQGVEDVKKANVTEADQTEEQADIDQDSDFDDSYSDNDEDDLFETEEHESATSTQESSRKYSAYSVDTKFQKLLSQDLLNALVSATLMKYIRAHEHEEALKLLRYIKLNRTEFSLLSFISLFKLAQKYPKEWLVDIEGSIIESIIANLRLWIGDSANSNFNFYEDQGLQLKREISDKLVEVGKSFSEYD